MSRAREKRDDLERMLNRIKKEFPKEPEAKLCCAVVQQAIRDIFYPGNAGQNSKEVADSYQQAIDYLSGEIPHAAVWGIEADWIRHFIFSMRAKYDSRTESRRHIDAGHKKAEAGRSRPLAETLGDAGQKRTATAGLS